MAGLAEVGAVIDLRAYAPRRKDGSQVQLDPNSDFEFSWSAYTAVKDTPLCSGERLALNGDSSVIRMRFPVSLKTKGGMLSVKAGFAVRVECTSEDALELRSWQRGTEFGENLVLDPTKVKFLAISPPKRVSIGAPEVAVQA